MKTKTRSITIWILAIALMVAATTALIIIFTTGDDSNEVAQSVTIDGSGIPPLPRRTNNPAGNRRNPRTTVPSVTTQNFAGEEVIIEADGNRKIVYFVAHWCPECRREIETIVELAEEFKEVDVYFVSTGVDKNSTNYPPSEWLTDTGLVTVASDNASGDIAAAYGSSGYPYAVYLDGNNELLFRHLGSFPKTSYRSFG